MRRVEKLERDVRDLNKNELAAFREWFRNYDAEAWDRQIEEDILVGRLDKIAEKALKDHRAGKTKEI